MIMYYITIYEDSFGFKVPDIHMITSEDKYISDEIYHRFFEEQAQGKSFRLKDINGTTFEEIFEEYWPTSEGLDEPQLSETEELKQRIAQLEAIVETLLKDKQS
jgi:hypothetical protein